MRFISFQQSSRSLRKTVASLLLAFSFIAYTPHSTFAKPDDNDPDSHYDGRVMGYDPDVETKSSGTGLAWLMVVALGAVCVSVIFKDAKRSHLD